MEESRASETAILAAVLRAAHQIIDDEPKILIDNVVSGLVPGSAENEIREMRDRLNLPPLRHLRSSFVSRSRFAEDELAIAVADGIEQLVILGAGLETFSHRRPAFAKKLRVVEVDHPSSQAFKRARMASLSDDGLDLDYCPIDFERTSLAEGLARSSFDKGRPSFFWWLGVVPYLTEPALDSTFHFLRTLPSEARMVFSFVLPEEALVDIDLETARFSAAGAGARGEPWLTRLEPDTLMAKLSEMGFATVSHLTPEACAERYFVGREDNLQAPCFEQLISVTSMPSAA